MTHYVYILESVKTKKYYIGVSNNVRRRFTEHNLGLSRSTAPLRPFILKRVERFENIKVAYQRERFLKNKKSRRIIELIIESGPDVLAEQEVGIPILR
ncbi:MAG: GIY-YIG nuclease family protein [Candidatus Wildermuthbacteria bacterium]|nr:GIY-YIG nuclease family protein [Candidatus Wildermuthbacteria bacterium]